MNDYQNSMLSKRSQAQVSAYCKILFYKVLGQAKLKHRDRNENPSFLWGRGYLVQK